MSRCGYWGQTCSGQGSTVPAWPESTCKARICAGLRWAQLDGADLSHADLRDAHLDGASLAGSEMTGARLRGAHLEGASLLGLLDLDHAQLEGAVADDKTVWPEQFSPREAGITFIAAED